MSKAELRQRRIRSVPGSEFVIVVIVVIVEHKGGNEVGMQLLFLLLKM